MCFLVAQLTYVLVRDFRQTWTSAALSMLFHHQGLQAAILALVPRWEQPLSPAQQSCRR